MATWPVAKITRTDVRSIHRNRNKTEKKRGPHPASHSQLSGGLLVGNIQRDIHMSFLYIESSVFLFSHVSSSTGHLDPSLLFPLFLSWNIT